MSIDDFHSSRTIKATRKAYECEQCGRKVDIGSTAIYGAGRFDGYFYTQHTHPECHAAAYAYAELSGCWGEEYPWFQHMDRDIDWTDWLLENHPIVAERLGLEKEIEE